MLNTLYESSALQALDKKKVWILYVNGCARQEQKGAGFILKSPYEIEFAYALKYNSPISNNEYEYETLLARLCMALAMNID